MSTVEELREQIARIDVESARLRQMLAEYTRGTPEELGINQPRPPTPEAEDDGSSWPLSLAEYKRYGRQMIMPMIGMSGMVTAIVHVRVSGPLANPADGRSTSLEEYRGADCRRRWPRMSRRRVPSRGRRRSAGDHRWRRRRDLESPPTDPPPYPHGRMVQSR